MARAQDRHAADGGGGERRDVAPRLSLGVATRRGKTGRAATRAACAPIGRRHVAAKLQTRRDAPAACCPAREGPRHGPRLSMQGRRRHQSCVIMCVAGRDGRGGRGGGGGIGGGSGGAALQRILHACGRLAGASCIGACARRAGTGWDAGAVRLVPVWACRRWSLVAAGRRD